MKIVLTKQGTQVAATYQTYVGLGKDIVEALGRLVLLLDNVDCFSGFGASIKIIDRTQTLAEKIAVSLFANNRYVTAVEKEELVKGIQHVITVHEKECGA